MLHYAPEPLDLNRPLYVRLEFRAEGRVLSRGDLFEWRKLDVPVNRLRALYRANYLSHQAPEEVTKGRIIRDKAAKKPEKPALPEKVEQAATYSIRQRSGQWFDVVDSAGNLANEKGMKKADAEALAAQLNG